MRPRKPFRSPFVVTAALAVLGAGCGSRVESTPTDGGVDGPGPGCPGSLPTRGEACIGTTTCSYNPCGTQVATCTAGRWELMEGSCNPPPPSCPPELPAVGDPCGPANTGFGGCSWADPCGTVRIAMYCDGRQWRGSGAPLPGATCPATLPPDGTSCAACVGRWPDRCEYSAGLCGSIPMTTLSFCDATTKLWRNAVTTCNPPPPPIDAGPAEAGPSSDAGPP
ncbi:MAG: hypothetical protein JNL79_38460 [Myxococcales bacterium]|nr:hypothetical protein [Myxococcales bacterium]